MYIPFILAPVLCVISAVILLRERHFVIWLMLAGGVLLISGVIVQLASLSMHRMGNLYVGQLGQWLKVSGALSGAGFLLFSVGLLLYALRQRAKASRIAELETIIASIQSSR